MDRSTLLALMVIFPAVAIGNSVFFGLALRRYLAETPRIESRAHMDRYKAMVKRQMYAALVQIALLATPALLFFYGVAEAILTFGDLLYIIVPSACVIGLGLYLKGFEKRARTQDVSDPGLLAERDEANEVWIHKPFPDW
jgi:hypothetical protein